MSGRPETPEVSHRLMIAALGLSLLAIYLLTASLRPGVVDELATFTVARDLAGRGSIEVGILAKVPAEFGHGSIVIAAPDGVFYTIKDLLPSILIIPFIELARGIHTSPIQTTFIMPLLVTALTAVVVYLTICQTGYGRRTALAGGLVYGVGTLAWPYSKTIFGQPLGALGMALAMWAALRARRDRRWQTALLCGVGVGIAGMSVVPAWITAPVFVAALIPWEELRARPWRSQLRHDAAMWAAFAAGAVVFLSAQAAYNWLRFGSVFMTGYQQSGLSNFDPAYLPMSTFGQLFSTSKGLLWYVPVTCLAVPGLVIGWRTVPSLVWLSAAVFVAFYFLYGLYPYWWGGAVWGLRYLVPVMPALVYMAIPWLDRALNGASGWARVLTALIVGLSIMTQAMASMIDTVSSELVFFGTYMQKVTPSDWLTNPVTIGPSFLPWPRFFTAAENSWWSVRWVSGSGIDWVILAILAALAAAGLVFVGLVMSVRAGRLARGWAGVQFAASIVVMAVMLVHYPRIAGADDNLYSLAPVLAVETRPGDSLFLIIPNQSLPTWLDVTPSLPEVGVIRKTSFAPYVENALDRLYQRSSRVWLVETDGDSTTISGEVRQWLAARGAAPGVSLDVPGYHAVPYTRPN